jgi:O-antigen ligase
MRHQFYNELPAPGRGASPGFTRIFAAESIFVVVIFVAIIFQLDAFIWLYSGGGIYTMPESAAAGVHLYSVARECVSLAIVIYLYLNKTILRLIYLSWPMTILAGYFLLSAAWSDYPTDSLRGFMSFAIQIALGFACCAGADDNAAIKRLKFVAVGLVAINFAFCLAFPALATGAVGYAQVYQGSWHGMFPGKNGLGECVALCVTLMLAGAVREGRVRLTFAAAASLVAAVGLVALSQSATGVATCAIAFVVFVVQFGVIRRAPVAVRVAIVSFIATAAIFGVAFADAIGELVASLLGRDPTFTGRTFLWDFALKMGDLRPILGYGFTGFWQPHVGPEGDLTKIGLWVVGEAHNGFVESYLFGGVIGLTLTVGLFAYLIGKSVLALLQRPGDPRTFFAFCVTLQILAQNLAESHFPNQGELAGTLLTVAIIFLQRAPGNRRPRPGQDRDWRTAAPSIGGPDGASTFERVEIGDQAIETR